jgi:hypothetical protein
MEKPEAVVLGGSLVSFLPEVTLEQRKAVRLAVRFARRATFDLFQEENASPPSYPSEQARNLDLFALYRRQLQFLGADGLTAERAHWPTPERDQIVDRALQVIRQAGSAQHASSMQQAFDALRSNPPALLHLTRYSQQQQGFQLIPCGSPGAGLVDMLVYFETGDLSMLDSTFLFSERHTTCVTAQLIRFDTRVFDSEHRSKVIRSLQKGSERDICEVPLS